MDGSKRAFVECACGSIKNVLYFWFANIVTFGVGNLLAAACGLTYVAFVVKVYLLDNEYPLFAMRYLSWDEYQYLPEVYERQTSLRKFEILSFFGQSEAFGYSDVYFQFLSISTLWAYNYGTSDSGIYLFAIRCVNFSFMIISTLIALNIVFLLSGRSTTGCCLLLLTLLSSPGCLLLYKPFSPDYFSLFFLMLSLRLLLSNFSGGVSFADYISSSNWRKRAAFFFLGIGVAVKIYAVLLLPIFLVFLGKGRMAKIQAILMMLLGLLFANSSILFNPIGFVVKYARLGAEMNADDYMHGIRGSGIGNRISNWFFNSSTNQLYGINTAGVGIEFINPFLMVVLIIVVIMCLKNLLVLIWRNEPIQAADVVFAWLLFGGLCGFCGTLVLTNRVWTWYLLAPFFFLSICVSTYISKTLEGRFSLKGAFFLSFVILSSIFGAYYVNEKYNQFCASRASKEDMIWGYKAEYVDKVRSMIEGMDGGVLCDLDAPLFPIPSKILMLRRNYMCQTENDPYAKVLMRIKPYLSAPLFGYLESYINDIRKKRDWEFVIKNVRFISIKDPVSNEVACLESAKFREYIRHNGCVLFVRD